MKLTTHSVRKPWGRPNLPAPFAQLGGSDGSEEPIGEIWFDAGAGQHPPLLVKYIFTSERLSVQVHPNDAQARKRGLAAGKSECWFILDAEPGATLGLGTKRALTAEQLRAASLDGSIEQLMDWKEVTKGDFFFVPAGTVHAIGAGISLVEIQQNVDVTYRLYDYGRPRELHLDDGVAVSIAEPYHLGLARRIDVGAPCEGQSFLAECPQFSIIHSCDLATSREMFAGHDMWVVPLAGSAVSGGDTAGPGECLWVGSGDDLSGSADVRALIGVPSKPA